MSEKDYLENTVRKELILFKEKKIKWLRLAENLSSLRQYMRSTKALSECLDISVEFSSALIDSYRYLEVQGFLSRDIKGPPTTICLLPLMKRRLAEKKRESEYPALVNDVLNGTLSRKNMVERVEGAPTVIDALKALKSTLQTLSYMIDRIKEEHSEDQLKEQVGYECHTMAMKLEDIFDPGFSTRETFNI